MNKGERKMMMTIRTDVEGYVLDNAEELDMRLSVVGYPTGEADTVRVYLDHWTLAEWEEVEFCEGRCYRDG